jgi:hypothetical protein
MSTAYMSAKTTVRGHSTVSARGGMAAAALRC